MSELLLKRIQRSKDQLKRLKEGTDPDLPDDPKIREYLIERHTVTLRAAERQLGDALSDEDLA